MPIAVGMDAFGGVEGVFVFRTGSEWGRGLVLFVDLKEEVGRAREPAQNRDGPSDPQVESV